MDERTVDKAIFCFFYLVFLCWFLFLLEMEMETVQSKKEKERSSGSSRYE